jgi:hypothetical protein
MDRLDRIENDAAISSTIARMDSTSASWPPLPFEAWADSCATLHMWTQIVGKVQLALAAPVNHWWHVAMAVTARGLRTSPVPYRGGTLEMAFDFIDHRLSIDMSDGRRRTVALEPKPVADFYREVVRALAELGINVRIWPMPVEVPVPIRFDEDRAHRSYDPAGIQRWWKVVVQTDAVLKEFRGRFLGKCSPVHFFWGSFDLAVTRFNGRRAPERPGADPITREAYSHEALSAGFWPGSGAMPDAAFYAYAAPEPAGYKTAQVGPPAAFYNADFNEFILKYEDMRTAASPRDTLLDFLQSTYEAGAVLANWDRQKLETSYLTAKERYR